MQNPSLFHMATTHADHAYVGTSLIAAGVLPNFFHLFNSATLQAIYFALLIPPAALHCYVWAKKYFAPVVKSKILVPVIEKVLVPAIVKTIVPVVEKVLIPVIVKVIPPIEKTVVSRITQFFRKDVRYEKPPTRNP